MTLLVSFGGRGSAANSASSVVATVGGGYDVSWWTVDGGGVTLSAGGGYALGGTAGQPDAGSASGGGYSLRGALWGEAAPPPDLPFDLYLPLLLRWSLSRRIERHLRRRAIGDRSNGCQVSFRRQA